MTHIWSNACRPCSRQPQSSPSWRILSPAIALAAAVGPIEATLAHSWLLESAPRRVMDIRNRIRLHRQALVRITTGRELLALALPRPVLGGLLRSSGRRSSTSLLPRLLYSPRISYLCECNLANTFDSSRPVNHHHRHRGRLGGRRSNSLQQTMRIRTRRLAWA